jgi:dTDP-4-amino-4,6-dideoxygalactose transaminase
MGVSLCVDDPGACIAITRGGANANRRDFGRKEKGSSIGIPDADKYFDSVFKLPVSLGGLGKMIALDKAGGVPGSDAIEFNTLRPAHQMLAEEIAGAVQRVLTRSWFTLGPELEAFEDAFARYHGVEHAVGVANGTDAIELALRAADLGPGAEVITVAHTAAATVCAIERAGARPVFVDIDPQTYAIDAQAVEAVITPLTRAIVPVHLYGHPADMCALERLAARYGLLLLEDCAQAHGARYAGRRVGTFGTIAAFSFYPTKNLGACGDGGAIITRDRSLADRLRQLRNYGQGEVRGRHDLRGVNSRLDEMQAAILSAKLRHLDTFNAERRRLADAYRRSLRGVSIPVERFPATHAYHLFVVRHPLRDALREHLRARGIGTLVHYPTPVHLQPAYADLGYRAGSLPHTEQAAAEIVSLPLYVGMTEAQAERVAQVIATFADMRQAAA